jgi:hypothetical protein
VLVILFGFLWILLFELVMIQVNTHRNISTTKTTAVLETKARTSLPSTTAKVEEKIAARVAVTKILSFKAVANTSTPSRNAAAANATPSTEEVAATMTSSVEE